MIEQKRWKAKLYIGADNKSFFHAKPQSLYDLEKAVHALIGFFSQKTSEHADILIQRPIRRKPSS